MLIATTERSTMGTVTTLPRSRSLTRRDLDSMPDDGHRYELIDGCLVVTPAPTPRHQIAVVGLWKVLNAGCPAHMRVLVAPLDVVLADDTVVQPDVLVARRVDFTERDLPVAPLLAIEVVSPSTRRIDVSLKRARYAAAGCPSYWVVDPDRPSLTAWDLQKGRYVEAAHVEGDAEYTAELPYPVTIRPRRLLD
jgi:Uma2 family endonuclease